MAWISPHSECFLTHFLVFLLLNLHIHWAILPFFFFYCNFVLKDFSLQLWPNTPSSLLHGPPNSPTIKYSVHLSSVAQSCLTVCDPMDCSLPVSSVHGILQARILEWVAISFSRARVPTPGPWTDFGLWPVRNQASRQETSDLGVSEAPSVFTAAPCHWCYCLSSASCEICGVIRIS